MRKLQLPMSHLQHVLAQLVLSAKCRHAINALWLLAKEVLGLEVRLHRQGQANQRERQIMTRCCKLLVAERDCCGWMDGWMDGWRTDGWMDG